MLKQFIITTTLAFLISGCTSQKIYIDNININSKPLKSHTFANTKLTATPKVSKLIYKIDKMQKSNSINLNLNATQNIQKGDLLEPELRESLEKKLIKLKKVVSKYKILND